MEEIKLKSYNFEKKLKEFVSKPLFDEKIILNKNPNYPKISIVTPSYNQADFLERTILSVLNQNYPNLEYIIIDGGSTDGSVEIIKKYEKYLSYWVSEKDKGQADAINRGFQKSTGSIAGWQNSDDVYAPNVISKTVKYLQRYPSVDLVFSDFCFINEHEEIIQEVRLRPFDRREYLYVSPNITNQTAFWRRELVSKVGGFNVKYKYAMDFDFFVRASEKGCFKYVKGFSGYLRVHAKSKTVTTGEDKQWLQEYAAIRERYGIRMDLNIPWNKQYRLAKWYFRLRRIFYYVSEGNMNYILKKLCCHRLVQQWNREDVLHMSGRQK
jgi:glycosyltransferase involved in cell wall biosynthesis